MLPPPRVGTTLVLFAAATGLAMGLRAQGAIERSFEEAPAGQAPGGFTFVEAREARAGRWMLQRRGDNTFLAHMGESPAGKGFVLAVLEGSDHRDVRVSVRLRLEGGERSGGLVWRYQDQENYYLARVSLSEREVALYRVVHGNRIRLEREDELDLDVNAWHTLRVVHQDESIRVYLGGIRVFRDRDRTFRRSGAVGLWSTESSIAHFDDLRIEEVG